MLDEVSGWVKERQVFWGRGLVFDMFFVEGVGTYQRVDGSACAAVAARGLNDVRGAVQFDHAAVDGLNFFGGEGDFGALAVAGFADFGDHAGGAGAVCDNDFAIYPYIAAYFELDGVADGKFFGVHLCVKREREGGTDWDNDVGGWLGRHNCCVGLGEKGAAEQGAKCEAKESVVDHDVKVFLMFELNCSVDVARIVWRLHSLETKAPRGYPFFSFRSDDFFINYKLSFVKC